MMKVTGLATFAFAAISGVRAWGADGHQAVGYTAMNFLSSGSLNFVKESLGSTYNESLGPAATWADTIKSQTAYKWSSVSHYIDAEDSPPDTCSVVPKRDCSDGRCILAAIANYTTRVVDDSLDDKQRQEALKWIDHYLGDIGQPLHVEAVAEGGNDFKVKCSGKSTNLHSVWDSGIIEKMLDDEFDGSVTAWSANLTARIQSGEFKSLTSDWLSCTSTTETGSDGFLACPLVWAKESNAFDCSFVFSYTDFTDLCTTSYYTNAIPIIELQIAKQGYRLAAWLNVLFDGATNL